MQPMIMPHAGSRLWQYPFNRRAFLADDLGHGRRGFGHGRRVQQQQGYFAGGQFWPTGPEDDRFGR